MIRVGMKTMEKRGNQKIQQGRPASLITKSILIIRGRINIYIFEKISGKRRPMGRGRKLFFKLHSRTKPA